MLRSLRAFALLIGSLLLVAIVLGTLLVAGRYLQVKLLPPSPDAPHARQKAEYLEAIEQVDAGATPNFVVILFDDLGYGDLSSYGNRLIDTPQIDRLAQQGVRMTAFYSASPVCTPSRAALLTGRYPIRSNTHNHVFFAEEMPVATLRRMLGIGNELPRDEILLPEVLGAAGYATGMVGKWHLGGIPGHLPNDFGFDSFYGVLWSNDMQPLHVYRDREVETEDTTRLSEAPWLPGSFRDEDVAFVRSGGVDQSQLTARYTREAVEFIRSHRDEPFFLYVAHTFPHVPLFADSNHAGESEAGLYGDVVEDLDRSTGAIVDAIDALGLAERTLVIVTSDNGPDYDGSPGGLRGRKGETYEGGQRVPLVARWTGRIPPGQVSGRPTMQIDLFPTLLELAELPQPPDREIDGVSLLAQWTQGSGAARDFLYYFSTIGGQVEAVRDARFKYFAAAGGTGREKGHLSRLDADAENHNLVRRYPSEAARLEAALQAMRDRVRDNPRGWK